MKQFSSLTLSRTALIAALYAAVTLPLGALGSQSILQIRPAEALTILPLLFPEATIGLTIGCMLSNLVGGFGIYDVVFGSAITLVAAFLTSKIKQPFIAALPPVILNAALLPLIWLMLDSQTIYLYSFISVLITQAVWIYGLGIPLYYILLRKNKGNKKL